MSYREYNSHHRTESNINNHRHKKSHSDTILSSYDKSLVVIVVFLVITGLLAIFSATAPMCMRDGNNLLTYLLKQGIFAGVGFFAMVLFSNYDYKKLERFNSKFMWFVIILLLIVKFTPLGMEINGAKRWINLGFMQLQPSEFAKPLFCLLLASCFKDKVDLGDMRNWSVFIPMIIILLLILKQPNLSMTAILFVTTIILYIAAKGSTGLLAVCGGLVCALIAFSKPVLMFLLNVFPQVLHGYQKDRIMVWLNPGTDSLGAGYNIIQSMIAFASGGLSGTGYGGSIQKLAYLPECHTDFIFAIIGEEFGYLGCIFVIGLFVALVIRGLRISKRCPDMYGKLLAIGITFIFGFQAFLNMSVSSSLLPVTGVTLPFISYGGTSIVVSLAMVGILLNISKQRIKKLRTEFNE